METQETKKSKPQQILNITDEDKATVKELKESLKLTDKELVSVLLALLELTTAEQVAEVIDKVVVDKQRAKIEAKIAKLKADLEAEQAKITAPVVVEEVVEEVLAGE